MRIRFQAHDFHPNTAPRSQQIGMDRFDRAAAAEGQAIGLMRGKMGVTACRPKPKRQACKGKLPPISQRRKAPA